MANYTGQICFTKKIKNALIKTAKEKCPMHCESIALSSRNLVGRILKNFLLNLKKNSPLPSMVFLKSSRKLGSYTS